MPLKNKEIYYLLSLMQHFSHTGEIKSLVFFYLYKILFTKKWMGVGSTSYMILKPWKTGT